MSPAGPDVSPLRPEAGRRPAAARSRPGRRVPGVIVKVGRPADAGRNPIPVAAGLAEARICGRSRAKVAAGA